MTPFLLLLLPLAASLGYIVVYAFGILDRLVGAVAPDIDAGGGGDQPTGPITPVGNGDQPTGSLDPVDGDDVDAELRRIIEAARIAAAYDMRPLTV